MARTGGGGDTRDARDDSVIIALLANIDQTLIESLRTPLDPHGTSATGTATPSLAEASKYLSPGFMGTLPRAGESAILTPPVLPPIVRGATPAAPQGPTPAPAREPARQATQPAAGQHPLAAAAAQIVSATQAIYRLLSDRLLGRLPAPSGPQPPEAPPPAAAAVPAPLPPTQPPITAAAAAPAPPVAQPRAPSPSPAIPAAPTIPTPPPAMPPSAAPSPPSVVVAPAVVPVSAPAALAPSAAPPLTRPPVSAFQPPGPGFRLPRREPEPGPRFGAPVAQILGAAPPPPLPGPQAPAAAPPAPPAGGLAGFFAPLRNLAADIAGAVTRLPLAAGQRERLIASDPGRTTPRPDLAPAPGPAAAGARNPLAAVPRDLGAGGGPASAAGLGGWFQGFTSSVRELIDELRKTREDAGRRGHGGPASTPGAPAIAQAPATPAAPAAPQAPAATAKQTGSSWLFPGAIPPWQAARARTR